MYTLVHFKPQENKNGGVQRYPMKSKVAGPLPNFGEIEQVACWPRLMLEKYIYCKICYIMYML